MLKIHSVRSHPAVAARAFAVVATFAMSFATGCVEESRYAPMNPVPQSSGYEAYSPTDVVRAPQPSGPSTTGTVAPTAYIGAPAPMGASSEWSVPAGATTVVVTVRVTLPAASTLPVVFVPQPVALPIAPAVYPATGASARWYQAPPVE